MQAPPSHGRARLRPDVIGRYRVTEIDLVGLAAEAVRIEARSCGTRPIPGRHLLVAGHQSRPGAQAFGAWHGETLVGFGYGMDCVGDEWWTERVRLVVSEAGFESWLDDAHQIVALHVEPGHQRRGLGRGILECLMAATRRERLVLSTRPGATPAWALYTAAGFTEIVSGFRFRPDEPAYSIMASTAPR